MQNNEKEDAALYKRANHCANAGIRRRARSRKQTGAAPGGQRGENARKGKIEILFLIVGKIEVVLINQWKIAVEEKSKNTQATDATTITS